MSNPVKKDVQLADLMEVSILIDLHRGFDSRPQPSVFARTVKVLEELQEETRLLRQSNRNSARAFDKALELLYRIGVCFECGKEIDHAIDEPFATCECGTGEDYIGPSVLQKLRMENRKLREALGQILNSKPKFLGDGATQDLFEWIDETARQALEEDK